MTGEQAPLMIVWNESFMTGIDICDEQHRGIVSIINSLYYSQTMENGGTFLRPTAEMLTGYTKIHFSTEIDLLEESAFPRLKEHRLLHDHLISEIDRILAVCLEEGGDPSQFLKFLKDWLLVHIAREDKSYSSHLKDYFLNRHRLAVK